LEEHVLDVKQVYYIVEEHVLDVKIIMAKASLNHVLD
jgi:hypothetical protein